MWQILQYLRKNICILKMLAMDKLEVQICRYNSVIFQESSKFFTFFLKIILNFLKTVNIVREKTGCNNFKSVTSV